MTALDILNKHQDPDKVLFTQVEVLAAMREIYEMGWKDCARFTIKHDSHLETRLKELFPEK